ncbi:uncharacterized protein LOC143926932 [Lithobates pipiens]
MLSPEIDRPIPEHTSSWSAKSQVDEEDTEKIRSSKLDRGLPEEDHRERTLSIIVARQQVLLENMVICDQMLVQLQKLRTLLASETNIDTETKMMAQEEVEEISSETQDYKSKTGMQDGENSAARLIEKELETEDKAKEELTDALDDTLQHTENVAA